MNILDFLKNGSKIHIKKENRGKFTSYCGGQVTNECIAKGKRSSDPTIRKRATFAQNARRWKHQNGGIINQSPIVDNSIQWQQDTSDYISQKNQQKLQQRILEQKNNQQKYSTILGGISNYLPSLLSSIPIFKNNAQTTTNNLSSDASFWKTPTISNSIDNNFWTNPIIKNTYDNNKKSFFTF